MTEKQEPGAQVSDGRAIREVVVTTTTTRYGNDVEQDESLNLEQAREYLKDRVSEEAIRKALFSGALRGRNMGGNVGWLTTKSAILEFIKRGNLGPSRADVRTKGQRESDHANGEGEQGQG